MASSFLHKFIKRAEERNQYEEDDKPSKSETLEEKIFDDDSQDGKDKKEDNKNTLQKTVEELEKKVNKLNVTLHQLKKDKLDTRDQDLNDTVIQSKKQKFLAIMDELDEISEHFSSIDINISRRIDGVSDQLYVYNKS